MFKNLSKEVTGVVTGTRTTKAGRYHNCIATSYDDKSDKIGAVIVWKHPKSGYEIHDFIPTDSTDQNCKFIIGHAVELAQAISGKEIDPKQKVEWAVEVYKKAVSQHVVLTLDLVPGVDKTGRDVTNVKYQPKSEISDGFTPDDEPEETSDAIDEIPF